MPSIGSHLPIHTIIRLFSHKCFVCITSTCSIISNKTLTISDRQVIFKKRLTKHYKTYVRSTKTRRPWTMVYSEQFATRAEAVARENQIKSWKSKVKVKQLVDSAQ